MVLTEEMHMPTMEELTVQEVNLSTPALRAAAFHLGKYCESKNNEYMLCRDEMNDPRACVNEGKQVTACALEFFRTLKKNCLGEFNTYSECVFKSSGDWAFEPCRQKQSIYDKCVLEKMNIERPEYGYYCRARIHDTDRPKPPVEKKKVYEDATPYLPDDRPRPDPKYGSRLGWTYE